MSGSAWIQTYTGRRMFPLDPRAEDVDIRDIAHALSCICRYGGHCVAHYSVAQHSLYVASVLPQRLKLAGLLHDAAEAYIGDFVQPLKQLMQPFREAEDRLLACIGEALGVRLHPLPPEVHIADRTVMLSEKRDIMARSLADWHVRSGDSELQLLPYAVVPRSSICVEQLFLEAFYALRATAGAADATPAAAQAPVD